MNVQKKIVELAEVAADGEIGYEPHLRAIFDFGNRIDFNEKENPFSEWEQVFIDFLHAKYCDWDLDLEWIDFLEEQGLYDDWLLHKNEMASFNAKYGLKGFDDED